MFFSMPKGVRVSSCVGVNTGRPILRAIAWPDGIPKLTWRIRLREANDCTPSAGRPGADPPRAGEQHHHAREPAVNPFVGPEIGCVEWIEGLRVDKPTWRASRHVDRSDPGRWDPAHRRR